MVTAEEEFNITKLQLLEAEKAKVRRDFERREAAIEVKKKVDYSKQLNESRIRVLQAQEVAVRGILDEAQDRLVALTTKDRARYKTLLKNLLIEAAQKLGERDVKVRCRKEDVNLVKEVISETSAELSGSLTLDESIFLPPAPSASTKSEEFDTCAGGVVVTSADGRIVCSNTLDDRLRIAYSSNLPALRDILFGNS
jgi:V-type H+-transporting ATPase subunit E